MNTANSPRSIWSNAEVKTLIAVWGEGNVQEELDETVRNKKIISRHIEKPSKARLQ